MNYWGLKKFWPIKSRPGSNTPNVGVPCGCGFILMIFIDFFPFCCMLPTYPILSSGSPEKINRGGIALVWYVTIGSMYGQKWAWPSKKFLHVLHAAPFNFTASSVQKS